MSYLEQVANKIRSGLGAYDDKLEDIVDTSRGFLRSITTLFDIIITITKIFIQIFTNIADYGELMVLIIPTLTILYVVAKLTQLF